MILADKATMCYNVGINLLIGPMYDTNLHKPPISLHFSTYPRFVLQCKESTLASRTLQNSPQSAILFSGILARASAFSPLYSSAKGLNGQPSRLVTPPNYRATMREKNTQAHYVGKVAPLVQVSYLVGVRSFKGLRVVNVGKGADFLQSRNLLGASVV